MRLLFEALRRRQWKLNLSFMLSTSSALRSGPKELDRTQPAVDLPATAEDGEAGGYTVIREGEAEILMPSGNIVFYNKAQVNSRDMSVAVLKTFMSEYKEEDAAMSNIRDRFENKMHRGTCVCPIIQDPNATEGTNANEDCKKRKNLQCNCSYEDYSNKMQEIMTGKCPGELKTPVVLEALAASGLRAIRYAREVDGIGQVVAIDNDKASIEVCKKNIQLNGPATCSKVAALLGDARVYMLTHPKEFDVVDLDPYGSPSIFLDSAVQAVADGGLLMCTATDLAVLCGDNGDVCYSKYGSYPLKGKYCHEMALRILLASIESHANRYKRFIVPVLSVYMDFYIRVFVRIYTSPIAMKKTPLKLAYVYQCVGCDSFYLQSIGRAISTKNNAERYAPAFGPVVPQACSDCGQNFNVGGPIWSAPIHDQAWVEFILEDVETMKERYPSYDRISSVLTAISEELHDAPLFLNLHSLCGTLKCTTPSSVAFQSVVMNAGFRISGTHTSPLGFKSDAPMHVIWDIMRCWVKSHPLKCQRAGEPGATILAKEPTLLVDFTQVSSAIGETRAKKTVRFRPNPERSYGPKLRAGRRIKAKHRSLFGQEPIEEVVSHEDEERTLNSDR